MHIRGWIQDLAYIKMLKKKKKASTPEHTSHTLAVSAVSARTLLWSAISVRTCVNATYCIVYIKPCLLRIIYKGQ